MASTEKKGCSYQLKIWRQKNSNDKGRFVDYQVKDISPDTSFLEMLDILNEDLIKKGDQPVEFDHDCREGICGTCSLTIDGNPHGPDLATTTCQLHMRRFKDGDTITIEPWRAKAFPVVKDLIVNRSSFDRVIASGGYISVSTGSAPDANSIPVSKEIADRAFAAATCIGCGACVAACKNASASLFVAAKLAHMNSLPQGQPEKDRRTLNMVAQMDTEKFGACTNTGACSAACPKEISLEFIAEMNGGFRSAALRSRD